ncbi:hypothetical protein FA95DRAFT_1566690 [Auriscalpium vulgare]|uniref:Uncharacterized protein n=1 Tax=Auriscalpium vulgare TaxID=40419 RepID=A0ACB8R860_9AGAM|nr:hypothetical protein FA95DRAFT_1566690 [Auriscalpium vulgare]
MHTLSAEYIGATHESTRGGSSQPTFGTINPDLWVLPPPPVFHTHSFPPLPDDPLGPMHDSLVRGTSSHVLRSHPVEVVARLFVEEFAKTEVVAMRFEKWEMDALWERTREDEGKGAVGAEDLAAERVTRQDALIAYLVTLQNRCGGEAPIHTVQHMMSVRLRQPPAASAQHLLHRHPHVASNCIQIPNIPLHDKRRNDLLVGAERGAWFSESLYEIAEGAPAWPACADEPQPAGPCPHTAEGTQHLLLNAPQSSLAEGASPLAPYTSLGLIARAFRRGTRLSRPDNWTMRYLRLNSARYKEGTRRGRFYMYPASGAVLVNSLMGVDTKDGAHFGFGPVQYYTDVSWERMFRVHDANPTRRASIAAPTGPCARWTWRDPAGAAVVCFRVQNGVRVRMEEAKARDLEVPNDALTW